MLNPLTKIMKFLGIRGANGPDIQFDKNWSPPGSAGDSKVPMGNRVATRRRKNKSSRKARKRNRK